MDFSRHYRVLELDKVLEMLADCCGCEDSRRLALNLQPEFELPFVIRQQQRTADANAMTVRYGSPSVYGIQNVSSSLRRAEVGASLTLREFLDISRVLKAVRTMVDYRKGCELPETALDYMFDSLMPNKYLEDRINTIVLSEEEISDHATPELSDIRRKIRLAGTRVREQLDKMIRSPSYQKFLQEQIVTQRDGRFVLPVKAEYKNEIKGMVHDTSSTGATFFIEPAAVVEANNEIRVLQIKEKQEVERIIKELSQEVGQYAQGISNDYVTLTELDLYFAKSRLGDKMRGSLPQISGDGETVLVKARHPLIDDDKIVPIDIQIGGAFDTLVITGPNTGGKTVAIKTLGLFTLMALCGLMLPVSDGSKVSVYKNVLADIGDEQSIEQSLSTFSAHMTNIISILNQAEHQSLVLLDELGAGTDPVEGAALAVAIIERLREQGALVAATTHYAELKVFALQTEGVENACCEFDVASLRPTYKLLIGVPGRSNAFAISQRLGLDSAVVERAQEHVSAESRSFEEVVNRLEESRQSMENEREMAEKYRIQAELSKRQIAEYKKQLERDRDKELEKARTQAQKLVEQVQQEAEKLVEQLETMEEEARKSRAGGTDAGDLTQRARAQMRAGVRRLQSMADPVAKKSQDYKLPRKLRRGDTVLITDIGKEGTVLSDGESGGYVLVQAGIFKTKVPVEHLRLIENKKRITYTGGGVTKSITSTAERAAASEFDMRGMTVDEGLLELDKYIDNCVLSHIHNLRIIHGKGTGALRAAVHQYLRQNKAVRTFRLGVFGEGESGVTVVELK